MDSENATQFDAYSSDYSDYVDDVVRFSGKSTEFFHRVKVDVLLSLLAQHQLPKDAMVLDVGCGTGSLAELVAPHVKQLHGADISEASIKEARRRVPGCEFKVYEGTSLPFDDDSIDLAFASCVMHHVPPENWSCFTAEMRRVVRPGGLVAVIEHNPWNPLTRVVVSTCEFDNDAVLLTRRRTRRLMTKLGLDVVAQPYILFFPWEADFFRKCETWLTAAPMGAQYVVVGRKRLR